jgi:hypothetical protein
MRKDRYELIKYIIDDRVKSGKWSIDLEKGTIRTQFGTQKAICSSGYRRISFSNEGKTHSYRVHEVIAVAGGLNPTGMVLNHKDGNRLNNSITNLEVTSHSMNIKQAHIQGFCKRKLTKEDVKEIKSLLNEGKLLMGEIAKLFGVSHQHIQHIKNGRRYKEVTV